MTGISKIEEIRSQGTSSKASSNPSTKSANEEGK